LGRAEERQFGKKEGRRLTQRAQRTQRSELRIRR
jgi:hypothetical protein